MSNSIKRQDQGTISSSKKDILHESNKKTNYFLEFIIPLVLLACNGAFYWAIRGTGGYGGSAGGGFAGIGWAICWYFLSHEKNEVKRRPYSSPWIVLAITFGMWYGGMHGWGQFNSWIKGIFGIGISNSVTVSVNPAWGFAAHFQCGMAWVGATGVFMAWCGTKRKTRGIDWIFRIIFGVSGAILSQVVFYVFPALVLPLYGEGYYTPLPTNPDSDILRTISTAQSSILYFGIFLGLLAYEIIRKEWRGVLLILVMGVGGGLSQMLSAFWHFGGALNLDLIPGIEYTGWWKAWEMSTGFFHGITIAVCYFLFNRPIKGKKILKSRKQPYSLHRTAEKELGMNFPFAFGISIAIRGGLQGLGELLTLDDALVDAASFLIIGFIFYRLMENMYQSTKNPYKILDGKQNMRFPGARWIIAHFGLILCGFIAAIRSFPLGDTQIVLVMVYGILLSTGFIMFMIRWFLAIKLVEDFSWMNEKITTSFEKRKNKSLILRLIKYKNNPRNSKL